MTGVRDAYPALSPDGQTLLFESNRSGHWALYLARPDGTSPRVLTDQGNPVVGSWSPDGQRIAFAADVDGQSEIFVINVDGSGRRRLTDDPGDDSHPHWSPDGTMIVFNSSRTTPTGRAASQSDYADIFVMRADGTNLREIKLAASACCAAMPAPVPGH